MDALLRTVAQLLKSGEVSAFLGWRRGTHPDRARPAVFRDPAQVSDLIWDASCTPHLAKMALGIPGRLGILAKGCDSRALVRLIVDGQLERSRLVILGLPCPLACPGCPDPNPHEADQIWGDPLPVPEVQPSQAYWQQVFHECLRCDACRLVCPACTCAKCIFSGPEAGWVERRAQADETQFFHMVRTMHILGRCVQCGACSQVCPVHLGIGGLVQRVEDELRHLLGYPLPGLSLDEQPPLGTYRSDDPENFG